MAASDDQATRVRAEAVALRVLPGFPQHTADIDISAAWTFLHLDRLYCASFENGKRRILENSPTISSSPQHTHMRKAKACASDRVKIVGDCSLSPVVHTQVDVCLFDKTGTITSDKLRAETLVTPRPLHPNRPPVAVSLGGSSQRGGTSSGSVLAAEVKRTRGTQGAAFFVFVFLILVFFGVLPVTLKISGVIYVCERFVVAYLGGEFLRTGFLRS